MKYIFIAFLLLVKMHFLHAQTPGDSTIFIGNKVITLSEVIVDKRLDVKRFIEHVQHDSSFYKAFKNLRLLGFTSWNDIRMLNKSGGIRGSLNSTTKQTRDAGCRRMQVLEEKSSGDFYDVNGLYNYYTAEMYASLFFTKTPVCGETNIVHGSDLNTSGKSGLEKHKQQLKMLFFNPGKKINGIPFMGNKTAIFDDDISDRYDINISIEFFNKNNCIVFHQKVKPGKEGRVVIDEMKTWFNDSTLEVVARNYHLRYSTPVYDFDVKMEVQMGRYLEWQVPVLVRYTGNWKAIFKKRERGIFTATMYDFEKTD